MSKANKAEPNKEATSIIMDYEKVPPFLVPLHYSFQREDDEAEIFGKMIQASANMATPLGTLNIAMGEKILLFVRREKADNTFRLGISQGNNADCSEAFPEEEFRTRLEAFEKSLMDLGK